MFRDEKGKEIGVDGMQFKMDGLTLAADDKTNLDHTHKRDNVVNDPPRSKVRFVCEMSIDKGCTSNGMSRKAERIE